MVDKRLSLKFKGLMAPVFTSFSEDAERSVQVNNVDKYAEFLKESGVRGVLVNGTTGEGPVLSIEERKAVTEKWYGAAKKCDLTLMVQIGGAPLPDVLQMASHAQKLGVDAVLCLPELYFKPKTVEALVGYLKLVSRKCPDIPFLYYHIPMFVGLNFDMPTFCNLAEASIPNFVGIKYTSNDLHMGAACLKPGRSVFLGADTLLSAALLLGFDSAIMTTLNICPEMSVEIINHMKTGQIAEVQKSQLALTRRVQDILQNGDGEWVPSMKSEFNRITPRGLSVGPVRELQN